MATRNKLKGVSPHDLAKLANQGGQKAAAAAYGVNQASVSRVLTKAGYKPVIVWTMDTPKEQVSFLESAS